jgi:hypothetical protein
MVIQNQKNLLMPVIRKFGGYVLRGILMMHQFQREQGKTNQLVAHTAIMTEGTLPKIYLEVV